MAVFKLPPASKSVALARTTGRQAAITAARGVKAAAIALRGAAGVALAGARAQNTALRNQLRDASPAEASKIVLARSPAIAANYLASTADASEVGEAIEKAVFVKPSGIALATSLLTLVMAGKKSPRIRKIAAEIATGTAHAIAARLGQRTPGAFKAAFAAPKQSTSGTGDVPPDPGEATDA